MNRGLPGPRLEKASAKGGWLKKEEADLWRPRKRTFVRWVGRREPFSWGRGDREVAL